MDNIKDILNNIVGQIASRNPKQDDKIERIWQNVLEKEELNHTRLDGMKNGSLFVNVDSPAWLYQMRTKKNKILRRIQEEDVGVTAITFRIGKV